MQNLRIYLLAIPATLCICLNGCKKPESHLEGYIKFTKADSLTEKYLDLEDSILIVWNKMINDDNLKIRMMHELVHELLVSSQLDKEELITIENRLNHLSEMKLTQESIKDPVLIEEYDFAVNNLVTELIAMAQSHETFTENRILQKMVDGIKAVDQRVDANRNEYDVLANEFNKFIDRNETYLNTTAEKLIVEKKALFQITSVE